MAAFQMLIRKDSPSSFLIIRVREEQDLLLPREYQAERPLHGIRTIILGRKSIAGVGRRTHHVGRLLVVLYRNRFLEIDRGNSTLRHIVVCDQVRPNDSKMTPSPSLSEGIRSMIMIQVNIWRVPSSRRRSESMCLQST